MASDLLPVQFWLLSLSLSLSRNALLGVLRDRDGGQNWTNLLSVISDKKVYLDK